VSRELPKHNREAPQCSTQEPSLGRRPRPRPQFTVPEREKEAGVGRSVLSPSPIQDGFDAEVKDSYL
jgi:hypothetical protein